MKAEHCSKCDVWERGLKIVMVDLQVDLTTNGKDMMKNFLFDVCGMSGTFTIKNREEKCKEEIVKKVGDNKVLVRILNWSCG